MVSTRAASRAASIGPEATPPPSDSYSSPEPASALSPVPATPSTSRRRTSAKQPTTTTKKRAGRLSSNTLPGATSFSHTPTTLTLVWLGISLPLVIWDTVYMLGRPHTFEGGALHWPLYVPYELYATVDFVYSPQAWEDRMGFSGAQGFLNAIETAIYFVYLYLFWTRAEAPATGKGRKTLHGRDAALASLVGFSAALMTLSKTVLYFAHEYFSDFANIGHNTVPDLVTLWIIPNTPWIILTAYMVGSFGSNILNGLAPASPSKSE